MEQDADFSVAMADYCLEELKYKADVFNKTGCVSLYHGDVVKSDVAIPKDLQEALKTAVAPLENIPDHMKDWHPDSNEVVLGLVHPSLYPLIYGPSRIVTSQKLDLHTCLSMSGTEKIVPIPKKEEAGIGYIPKIRGTFDNAFSQNSSGYPTRSIFLVLCRSESFVSFIANKPYSCSSQDY